MTNIARLRDFVRCFTRQADQAEQRIFVDGRALLAELIAHDDWLLPQFAASSPQRYQQYLLHCDRLERFSVARLVWGPASRRRCTTICRCPVLCV
ncbi:hypothetical protein [Massilia psychrophila]|jgi:predicted metal-dependent enzyme (double-stranded beta helix superfamily)|uniref:Uncharacterized protein n=1 Tax=Massilia psychrophila TaxID=1603353 RepID=A0A2G8SY59_9BURK|nr:hypothetical protein [Massilia psychrophila]PIL38701.1 hypothetical protein CR103_16865 [Massilia psychrophila]GGE81228.1 hypothetical protein GCM10008020_27580 [Massilia psychrophila]